MEPSAACLANSVCAFVFDRTGNAWLADSSYYALITPGRIIAILAAAILLRLVVRRIVKRVVRRVGEHPRAEANSLRSQRRLQRAEALGAVLRSLATATIFTAAMLLVISELGVDLAPLIAGAGFLGLSLGIGAQHLVKDVLAGMFMLLEDQYGVGDVIQVGDVTGVVEAVSLRTTTIRDGEGVLWYVRNGEVNQVGNRSQGWAATLVDVPVGFTRLGDALAALRRAADAVAADPEFAEALLEPPDVGVEQITADGAVVRVTAKSTPAEQLRVARELRRRLTEALEETGLSTAITANRIFVRQQPPPESP